MLCIFRIRFDTLPEWDSGVVLVSYWIYSFWRAFKESDKLGRGILDLQTVSFFEPGDPVMLFGWNHPAMVPQIDILGMAWKRPTRPSRPISKDTIFNICGVFTFALFISITLFVVDPLRCGRNPDGSLSMLSNPGVICFDSGEHFMMLFLCILGILCYPMTIISWATYTTCSYPSRITSGRQHVLDVHPWNQEVIELHIPIAVLIVVQYPCKRLFWTKFTYNKLVTSCNPEIGSQYGDGFKKFPFTKHQLQS